MRRVSRGVIYFSHYNYKYSVEASVSAKSVRANNNLEIAIVSDLIIKNNCFDKFIYKERPSIYSPFLNKISMYKYSPFDETLYLDTDTRVMGDLNPMFKLLKNNDFWVGECGNESKSSKGMLNSGVVLFKKSSNTENIFKEWVSHFIFRMNDNATCGDQESLDSIKNKFNFGKLDVIYNTMSKQKNKDTIIHHSPIYKIR